MAVYDDQKHTPDQDIGDDYLRHLTNTPPDEEEAMEREAYSGAAEDIADQENKAKSGGSKTRADKAESSLYSPDENDKKDGWRDRVNKRLNKRVGLGLGQKLAGRWSNSKAKKYGLLGSGVLAIVGILALITLVFMLLNSLKLQHFSHVLAATGYPRFNGITQERTTQTILDASLVEGEGTIVKGKLVNRLLTSNIDNQIAELARQKDFRFIMDKGRVIGARTGEQVVTLDGLTKKLGFGESFEALRTDRFGSIFNPKNVADFRKIARIRHEFTLQTQNSLGKAIAQESRFIRSDVFARMAKGVGFQFSRWRQAGRDFIGKTAIEADVDDRVEQAKEVTAGSDERIKIEDGDVKGTVDQMKSADKLKTYLEKTGGTFDSAAFAQSVNADIARAVGVQDALTTISTGALLVSLGCMAEQAYVNADGIAENNEAQASNMALMMMAADSQLRRGGGVISSEAIGAAVRQLNGAEATPAYQAQTGRPAAYGDNADVPRVVPNFAVISSVLGTLTGSAAGTAINKTCEAILSPAGLGAVAGIDIIGQTIVALLSGGSSTVATQGGLRLIATDTIGQLGKATWHTAKGLVSPKGLATAGGITLYAVGLHLAAGALAGTNFLSAEQGGARWERYTAGTVAVQNRQTRIMGGVPLTTEQARTVDSQYSAVARADIQRQNYFARYFSLGNPYSLTGQAVAHAPTSWSETMASVTRGVGKLGSIFQLQWLGNWGFSFTPPAKAYAQTAYDPYYGQIQKGFTPAELDKMRNDPSYSIAENENHITPAEVTSLDNTIGTCFDPNRSEYSVNKDPNCAADKLTTDQAFRYRLYKFLDEPIVKSSEEDLANPKPINASNLGGT